MSSFRNSSIDLLGKSIDWFLYDGTLAFNELIFSSEAQSFTHNLCFLLNERVQDLCFELLIIFREILKCSFQLMWLKAQYRFSNRYSLKLCLTFVFKFRNLNIPANHIVGGLLHSSGVFKIYNITFCENSCIIDMFGRVINTTWCSTNELIFLLQNSCYVHFIRIDEFFLWYGWPTKGIQPYFQPGPLSEIFTIANLRHVVSRVWTCAEPEFRLSWMNLCSSDNRYTTAPKYTIIHLIGTQIFRELTFFTP